MSEEKKNDEQKDAQKDVDSVLDDTGEADLSQFHLKKHLWKDERELKHAKDQAKHLKIALVVVLICALLVGWCGGTLVPMSWLSSLKNRISESLGLNSSNKIQEVIDVMENDWYFGSSIDNLDERLTDQALTGITSNDEDTHTEYMSADEISSFTQSINRSYVGIGVSYIQNGDTNMIEEVFLDSPADKAGVQSGDIIYAVDGESVEGKSTDEIKSMIQGDAGTKVSITFLRNGSYITLDITREAVSATTYGKKLDDGTVYLRMVQFGTGTPTEVKNYLNELATDDSNQLIIDLRNDGGGYLDTLSQVAGLFLPSDSVCLVQNYKDGTTTSVKTSGTQFTNINGIVILVNQNTASAAEAFTLCMKELRDDVTVVGTTTYGKGTVQVTRSFDDGSALKYTTSTWSSPNGTCINGTGITPDIEVKLHDVMYETMTSMEDDESYSYDSVADAVKDAQLCLDYLGYGVDRKDGYFSAATADALTKFQQDYSLSVSGTLDRTTYEALQSAVALDWSSSTVHDTQLLKAEEVLHG